MNRVTIVGCGYVGRKVALDHLHNGDDVSGIVSSKTSAEELSQLGINPIRMDLDDSRPMEINTKGSVVYYFVPPPRQGVTDPRVDRVINHFSYSGHPLRVVYISTTGVYGDCSGRWIDESEPVNPAADRAKRRFSAEQGWRQWSVDSGGELVILRVAGIYGPGRIPLERLRKGLPLLRAKDAPYTNRIHVDDLVKVCISAMKKGNNGKIYNVSDGHPSTMVDYFNRIADLCGLPRPPVIDRSQAEGQLSSGMLSYMNESRRLSNQKMLDELGITLDYPDLDSGLASCI